MAVSVRDSAFDPWTLLRDYQEQLGQHGKYGATAVFVGTLRDYNLGAAVEAMLLEHYPGMTEKFLQRLCDEAAARWPLMDMLIVHRCGALQPHDTIVLVAVWAAHRAGALDACRYLIEELKQRAPFWKQESLRHGTRWVEHNTP